MFTIDPMSRTPVYGQIIEQVEKFIALGILKPGDAMPSVRNLSVELSVNPNTIQKTFNELMSRGLTVSVPGKGSFISQDAPELIKNKSRAKLDDFKLLVKELHTAGLTIEEIGQAVKDAVSEME